MAVLGRNHTYIEHWLVRSFYRLYHDIYAKADGSETKMAILRRSMGNHAKLHLSAAIRELPVHQ